MAFDWAGHAKHRQQVIKDFGQWIGLLDEDGIPLMDLPAPVKMVAPETRNSPESMTITIPVRSPLGIVHPAVSELIADGLGEVTAEGRLEPANVPTRWICIEREGATRRAFKVGYSKAVGGAESPATIQAHCTDFLDCLDALPCPSIPGLWRGKEWRRLDRDYAAEWEHPRDVKGVEMALQADGFTVSGPAEATIRKVMKDSLDAVYDAVGITSDHPFVVSEQATGRPSPDVLIRPQDKSIWDELGAIAAAAGVRIWGEIVFPGDEGSAYSLPTIVFHVEQAEVNG